MDTTPKATAIFWVDKNKKLPGYMSGKPVPIRTLKAQVEIDTVGCIEVLSYRKIRFTVSKILLPTETLIFFGFSLLISKFPPLLPCVLSCLQ